MNRNCINHKYSVVVCLLAMFAATAVPGAGQAAETTAAVREQLLGSTVRIRYERQGEGATITGHGTAFGVDLSQYGFSGRNVLLSAAHNVLDDNKRPYSTLKIEIKEGNREYWSRCKVLAWNEDLDVCLVETGDTMPTLLTLGESEPAVGTTVTLAGSPRGIPVALFEGVLEQKYERGSVRSRAVIPFDHGDSGGPVVCPRTGTVIGVAVAGVPKDGDLDKNLGLFVPIDAVRSFLNTNRRGAPAQLAAAPRRANASAPIAAAASTPTGPVALSMAVAAPDNASSASTAALAEGQARWQQKPQFIDDPQYSTKSVVILPARTPVAPVAQAPVAAKTVPAGAQTVHVVQSGESLGRIARQYNVPLNSLIAANNIKDPNRVMMGAQLVVPK